MNKSFVMAGLVPAIHVLLFLGKKTWMPGTRPGMTKNGVFVVMLGLGPSIRGFLLGA